jgi:phage tail-like protein
MARSSKTEPVEKFRFQVRFFSAKANSFASPIPNITQVITGTDAGAPEFDNSFKSHLSDKNNIRAGFTDVSPPKATVNVIQYRENTHMNRSVKQPGLVTYDPVTLKRGVTGSRELYNWFKEVHNDVADLNSANQVLADVNVVPVHDPKFRREMVISVLDREGVAVKHWLCINCFPVSYKGGDDLSASSQEKLIEELVVVYEAFIELNGSNLQEAFQNAQTEANEAVGDAIKAALIGASAGALLS